MRHWPPVSTSEQISRAFYAQLGADGLARRTRQDRDDDIVAAVREMLGARRRVLDIGCGYGRIAVPLACDGRIVQGVDLSSNLIDAASKAAAAEGVTVGLVVG